MTGWLLRRGLPRDPRAEPHLLGFVVAAVTTVLITRALLSATGYPKLGGGGLHIAHVLWGGLLMLVALIGLLSFIGPVVRRPAAFVGGIGFGLFIDEVGKFVTSPTDYFYKPAAMIMYVVVLVIVAVVRLLHTWRPISRPEYLAGAVDEAVVGVAAGFSPHRLAVAQRWLDRAGVGPARAEARVMILAAPARIVGAPDPFSRIRSWADRFVTRYLATKLAVRITVVVLLWQALIRLLVLLATVLVAIVDPRDVFGQSDVIANLGATLFAAVSAAFIVTGAMRLRRQRAEAFVWFQWAILVDLLLTQVFRSAISQFGVMPSVLFDLLMLVVIGIERRRYPRSAIDDAELTTPGAAGDGI